MNTPDHPPPAPTSPSIPAGSGVAPPTSPGRLVSPGRASVWPDLLGIICSIFGGLGLLLGILVLIWYGVMATGVMDSFLESIVQMGATVNTISPMKDNLLMLTGAEVLKGVLAALLLIVGLRISARRPSAIKLANAWSIGKIIFTIFGTAIGLWVQEEALRATFNGSTLPPNAPAFATGMAKFGAVFGLVFSIAWGCALPVFLLIWFRRPRIRAEVSQWREPIR